MGTRREDGHHSSARSLNDISEFDTAVTAAIGSEARSTSSEPIAVHDSDAQQGSPLDPGYRLSDRYEILERVHSSSMSHVYKALDTHDEGPEPAHVAIKMLRRAADLEVNADRLLEQEAAKARKLKHPNVVRVFRVERHDDRCYLVMEWLDGESLNDLLRRSKEEPLTTSLINRIVSGIVTGVGHAHDRDIVHADLNPANVFITDSQEVKLLDFGVARYADEREDPGDEVPAWATYNYASPQVLNQEQPTKSDDVFSLACLIYRLRSGHHPFGRQTALQAKEAGFKIKPIAGLDMAAWTILRHGLSYQRRDRPHGVAVFLLSSRPAQAEQDDDGPGWWPLPRAWQIALPAITVAGVAALWAYLGTDSAEPLTPAPTEDVAAVTSDVAPNAIPPTETEPTVEDEIAALLNDASVAMAEERRIEPDETSARHFYSLVLERDPDNEAAQSGLRAISDYYVQSAAAALRAEDPAAARADLDIATETFAGNPSVLPVVQLLQLQGDSKLAEARLAISSGARERAAALLAQAEAYAHIDASVISELRDDITRSALAARFQDQLAIVDAHIAADRLLEPETGNAHAMLLAMRGQYGDNRQLLAYTERFGERLLTRAALATAMQQFDEAESLLTAVAALQVLESDATVAQTTLELAKEQYEASLLAAQSQPANDANDAAGALPALPGEDTGLAESGSVVPSGVKADTEIEKSQYSKLSDMAIQEYVEPLFPALAEERNQTGYVELAFDVNTDGSTGEIEVLNAEPGELFITSATNAVGRWRFAERDDVARTRVRLTFVLPQ